MDTMTAGSDEPVIRKFERIIISGVRHEAVLTATRLILRETATGTARREAEYPRIVLANLGVNTLREPEISLSFAGPGGEVETEDLVFVHLPAGQNINEADRCMDILREHNVPTRRSSTRAEMGPPSRADSFSPSDRAPAGRQAVPDLSRFGSSGSTRAASPPPPDKPQRTLASPVVLAGLVLGIILAIAGVWALGGMHGGPAPQATVTPVPVPVVTPIPAATTPAPATPVPEPVLTPDATPIPTNGIWLVVTSPGPYTGDIKAGSWTDTINTTGPYRIQIVTQNTLIEGIVEKTDGSGNPLDVKIYNGGEVIYAASTSKPHGTIEIRQQVGQAVVQNPAATPAPVPVVSVLPTPDPALELRQVPLYGIFMRVSYNGTFTGTVRAISYDRQVTDSGDMFYQLPVGNGGMVDAVIEKTDGSNRDLVLGLYDHGTLLEAVNTTKPYGSAEIHTIVLQQDIPDSRENSGNQSRS